MKAYGEALWFFNRNQMVRESEDFRLKRLRVRYFLENNDPVGAARILNELERQYPMDAGVWADQGLAMMMMNRPHQAWSHYSRALALNPENEELIRLRQNLYREIGNRVETSVARE